MELGERIAGWRAWKGLTRRQLAMSLGVTAPAVYQWEDGTTMPSLTHLEKFVLEILEISMERFYGRVPRAKAAS